MNRPNLYNTSYTHDRRARRHRCQCCWRIIETGEAVVMWKVTATSTRALHAACADKPSVDGLTQRELAQLHSDEYAQRLGFRVPTAKEGAAR